MIDLCAAAAVLSMIAYAVLAGADFGGGIWDLLARGPRKDEHRAAIARAMGPVWEANHVWLIFVVVIFFSAFPSAWGMYTTALAAPLRIMLLGIVLRGVAFVFRAYAPHHGRSTERWGVIFGATSIITPFVLGMCVGAISSPGMNWLSPIALCMGGAFASLCPYLAAVFLTVETEGEVREDFRTRALLAGGVVIAGAMITLPFTKSLAPHLWEGLIGRAFPIVVAGTVSGAASLFLLQRRRFRVARLFAAIQVSCVIVGWAVAQHPYLIYPDVTLASAAAPIGTLQFVLYSLPFGLGLILPSFWYLFRVFKGDAARLT
jgi:cytochrome bd ubiquinol oxidase subunit II